MRRFKKTMKKVKLSDNLPIGGRNRLTDAVIDQLQTYYGKAIRKNTNSLEKMREAVWAIYWHKYSTNEKPFHGLCPCTHGVATTKVKKEEKHMTTRT